jgi:Bax protein
MRAARVALWCFPVLWYVSPCGASHPPTRSHSPPQLAELAYQAPADVPRRELRDVPYELCTHGSDQTTKKELFIETLLPLVLLENESIAQRRDRMLGLFERLEHRNPLSAGEQLWLRSLADEYRVSGDPVLDSAARRELGGRVDIVPADLALAQAAAESGWGGSHAARIDRDLFGMKVSAAVRIWPPRATRHRKGQHAPRFASLREAVHTYMLVLNSHAAYGRLRELRASLRGRSEPVEGSRLAAGLERYSTRGKGYVRMIQGVIRRNQLERYRLATLLPFTPDDPADSTGSPG